MRTMVFILIIMSGFVRAHEDKYKCIDIQGGISYQEIPCHYSERSEERKHTYKNKTGSKKTKKRTHETNLKKLAKVNELLINHKARHEKLCLRFSTDLEEVEEKLKCRCSKCQQLVKVLELMRNNYKKFCQ